MALIVTADDDTGVRQIIERALHRAGHRVVATADGEQALAAVREHRPDAVVTDVDMPHMTGLQLCQAIRSDPDLMHTPVVVVSGSIDLHDPHSMDTGVTVIVSKPFTAGELVHCLTGVLGHPSQRSA